MKQLEVREENGEKRKKQKSSWGRKPGNWHDKLKTIWDEVQQCDDGAVAVPFARGCDHVSAGHLINHSTDVCPQIELWNVVVAMQRAAVDEDECRRVIQSVSSALLYTSTHRLLHWKLRRRRRAPSLVAVKERGRWLEVWWGRDTIECANWSWLICVYRCSQRQLAVHWRDNDRAVISRGRQGKGQIEKCCQNGHNWGMRCSYSKTEMQRRNDCTVHRKVSCSTSTLYF